MTECGVVHCADSVVCSTYLAVWMLTVCVQVSMDRRSLNVIQIELAKKVAAVAVVAVDGMSLSTQLPYPPYEQRGRKSTCAGIASVCRCV